MEQKENSKYNQPKKKKGWFFSCVKSILRLFYKKPKTVYQGKQLEQPSIVISNHVALKGPVIHELYLPVSTVKWGAGEMLGNYKMRYNYLRNIFYMQKKGYGKVKATLLAVFSAFFSKFFYKGMKVIPTWHDARMLKTVSHSIETLNDGTSVLIFPENSIDGYHEILTEFHPGFVTLAETYFKRAKRDVPVYPVYHHEKTRTTVVGEPRYVQDYVKQGFTRTQIAEEFRKIVNDLYTKYFLNSSTT